MTLAVTPLRRLSGWSALAPLRRTLGLAAFGYVCLHLLTYVVLDQFFDWHAIVEDVLHHLWLVKSDLRGPLVHAGVLALLLGSRWWLRAGATRSRGPQRPALYVEGCSASGDHAAPPVSRSR